MSPWERLLQQPVRRSHFLQLHREDASLYRNVGLYIAEGLNGGQGVLVIATPEHWDGFRSRVEELGIDTVSALRNGRLVYRDARRTLAEFVVDGRPDWRRFERSAHALIRQTAGGNGLRAYGEMVDLLWQARHYAAALRLEQLWNKLLEQSSFTLYCSYGIDVFGGDFNVDNVGALLCTHSHLVPGVTGDRLEKCLYQAMDEVIGKDAARMRTAIKTERVPGWGVVPNVESTMLWLRRNAPGHVGEVARRSRSLYDGSAHAPHD